MSRQRFTVSLYAASPTYRNWQPRFEAEFMSQVLANDSVAGFELPWLGKLHPHDVSWLIEQLPASAKLVLTPLPWVMQQQAVIPGYGLASPDAVGRAAAITDMARLAEDISMLHDSSAARVATVLLHSAPSASASAQALAESRDELLQIDWSGAQLAIEHCDALVPGQSYEKGFLTLADEIAICRGSGSQLGMWMNWGRSIIETRSAEGVLDQLAGVADAGVFAGFVASGASAVDGHYGVAWADAHLPIAETDAAAASLLDAEQLSRALALVPDSAQLGLKVSRKPSDHSPADIAATLAEHIELMTEALEHAPQNLAAAT